MTCTRNCTKSSDRRQSTDCCPRQYSYIRSLNYIFYHTFKNNYLSRYLLKHYLLFSIDAVNSMNYILFSNVINVLCLLLDWLGKAYVFYVCTVKNEQNEKIKMPYKLSIRVSIQFFIVSYFLILLFYVYFILHFSPYKFT